MCVLLCPKHEKLSEVIDAARQAILAMIGESDYHHPCLSCGGGPAAKYESLVGKHQHWCLFGRLIKVVEETDARE